MYFYTVTKNPDSDEGFAGDLAVTAHEWMAAKIAVDAIATPGETVCVVINNDQRLPRSVVHRVPDGLTEAALVNRMRDAIRRFDPAHGRSPVRCDGHSRPRCGGTPP